MQPSVIQHTNEENVIYMPLYIFIKYIYIYFSHGKEQG